VDEEGGDPSCWANRVCDACGAMVQADTHVCPRERRPVTRRIVGFHQDGVGDWVAELSCRHNQHIRHEPPFQLRPWVVHAAGRATHVGTDIDCYPCSRAELPEGLAVVRTAGPFDSAGIPTGLLSDHVVAAGRWGCLHVIEGGVTFSMQTEPPTVLRLVAGDRQAIPPEIRHALTIDGPVCLTIDFLAAPVEAPHLAGQIPSAPAD
jgi:tellurite methyltransferase